MGVSVGESVATTTIVAVGDKVSVGAGVSEGSGAVVGMAVAGTAVCVAQLASRTKRMGREKRVCFGFIFLVFESR